jgi:hypothetical protein
MLARTPHAGRVCVDRHQSPVFRLPRGSVQLAGRVVRMRRCRDERIAQRTVATAEIAGRHLASHATTRRSGQPLEPSPSTRHHRAGHARRRPSRGRSHDELCDSVGIGGAGAARTARRHVDHIGAAAGRRDRHLASADRTQHPGGLSRLQGIRMVVPGAGLEPAWPRPGDFKSPASTDFATRAARHAWHSGCREAAAVPPPPAVHRGRRSAS